ncbi:TM2 domain-containing protein [Erythrobacter sp. NE805]|uniref:TM2 domain-containing protein n=1 Tax=Erythrobacter sp. NE805 TaxID=3389875 RepID=UPI00396B20AE
MSFGRKGVAPGAGGGVAAPAGGAALRTRPAMPAGAPVRPAAPLAEDPYAAQREAFLTAERARRAAEGSGRDHDKEVVIPYPRRGRAPGQWGTFGDPAKRSLLLAYVLWNFCSPLGMHRFYCGASESAWYQLALFYGGMVVLLIFPPFGVAMLGVWAVWIFADLFLMPGMMRRFKAAHRADFAEVFA